MSTLSTNNPLQNVKKLTTCSFTLNKENLILLCKLIPQDNYTPQRTSSRSCTSRRIRQHFRSCCSRTSPRQLPQPVNDSKAQVFVQITWPFCRWQQEQAWRNHIHSIRCLILSTGQLGLFWALQRSFPVKRVPLSKIDQQKRTLFLVSLNSFTLTSSQVRSTAD